MSISESIEYRFKENKTAARMLSLDFYQRIIEDIVGQEVLGISYNENNESLTVVFKEIEKRLEIDIEYSELRGVTRDVIGDTIVFYEEVMGI